MKKILIALAVLLTFFVANAGTREDFATHPKWSANNYAAYPEDNLPRLTPAPDGYVPFYMNHYGRHGSRWLINAEYYDVCVRALQKGADAGKLTDRGMQVLAIVKEVQAASYKRLGELSDLGAEQHSHIAWRMYHNFPEIFDAKNVPIDAKSTIVIRCILSMQNEADQLKALNPTARVTTDASEHDMYFMNYKDSIATKLRRAAIAKYSDGLKAKYLHPEHMLGVLYSDRAWASQNIDGAELLQNMFDVAGNMQSHHAFEHYDLYDLFSIDDLVNTWAFNNARWYLYSGNTPLTQNRVPYMEANLLRNFLQTAGEAVAKGEPSANLRFGHESVVLPLVCLMGINGYDHSTTDVFSLVDTWQSYKVFPMACNVQWIFYKNKSGNVLMKCLLNEHEAHLPQAIKPVQFPYYNWKDVQAYYENKLSNVPQVVFPE